MQWQNTVMKMTNITTQQSSFTLTVNPRLEARMLYFAGWTVSDISRKLDIPRSTVSFWRDDGQWDKSEPYTRCEATTEGRYQYLIAKESKSNGDYKELEALARLLDKLFFPKPEKVTNKRASTINKANFDWTKFVSQIDEAMGDLYPFQIDTMNQIEKACKSEKSSGEALLLKPRQAGFTRTLAHKRFHRAIKLMHNQIFISASKNQAFQSKSYITKLVKEATGIELQGKEKIIVKDGLELYFLGCNVNTAQGYSGDVTLDEYMWMPQFEELSKVVGACATLDHFNVIYSSTPSSKKHPAYKLWTGYDFNKTAKNKGKYFKTDHKTLKNGLLCNDGKFRKIITIDDAIEGGLQNISKAKLMLKYPDESTFNQLFMCEFMDEASSAFNFDQILNCMVDIMDEWPDFKPFDVPNRPLGNAPVAVGFDPARSHDGSVCVVMAVPIKQGDKFRVVEKLIMHGVDFEDQAQKVKDICNRYNVVHLGIDANGLGVMIAERIETFYPRITRYIGNPVLKSLFVLQAQNMFSKKRISFDRGWIDLIQSFIAIKKVITKSGNATTYHSDRTEQTSHSDLAWACMYAFGFEQFDGTNHLGDVNDYVATF